MTIKTRKVGSGITRRTQIVYKGADAWNIDDESAAFIYAHEKFEAFLEQQESKLAAMLEHFGLPKPGRHVVWDKKNLRDWRYNDRIGIGDPRYEHEKGPRSIGHTEWYLMAWRERADSFWYLGKLLLLLQDCRSAFDREAWLELAGRAYYFGCEHREMRLKFSGDKRLRDFEKHVAAADKGNATKKQRAAQWQRTARQILSSHPEIDPHNALNAAREILKYWPADERQPSERTLRAYKAKST